MGSAYEIKQVRRFISNQCIDKVEAGDRLHLINEQEGDMKGRRGQAATELAIFGSIMLIVVGTMVNYGQTMATQQELEMYAFRRALQLSRARINDAGAPRQVGFTVFKEVYPVNLLGSQGVEKSQVSASASVDWESDAGDFKTDDDPAKVSQHDFGVQYWQLGRKMIKNNELIEMPRMQVQRKKDREESRGFIESLVNGIEDIFDDDNVIDWESVPIDQTLVNKVIASQASEENKQEGLGKSNNLITSYNNATTMEGSALTMTMQSASTIKSWDPKIIQVYPNTMPGNVIINESTTSSKKKEWKTKVK